MCLHGGCHCLLSTTSLACNWLDGGNLFGLHACVFLCAGQNITHKSGRQLWEVSGTLACHKCTHSFSSVRQFVDSTHLLRDASADSCLKYRFGSQLTDMTDAFFLSLLVIQFLLSFIFLSAYSPSVFTASGNEHKANTIFHHHHLHDYNTV